MALYRRNFLLTIFKSNMLYLVVIFLILYRYFNVEKPVDKITKEEKIKEPHYLIIAIMTEPSEVDTRNIIRRTWLKLFTKSPSMMKHLFLFGTKSMPYRKLLRLQEEQTEFNDLAFLDDVVESYNNLARKIGATLKFIDENYVVDYVLKVDTDSFVQIDQLIDYLLELDHPRLYLGYMDGKSPVRRYNNKWQESEWNYCDVYIPYHTGGGYVLGKDIVHFVARNYDMLRFYQNEDVSLATWISGLNIKTVHDVRFDTEWDTRGCQNDYLITHKRTPQQLETFYNNLRTSNVLCEKEMVIREAYVYNFTALPSLCCLTETEKQRRMYYDKSRYRFLPFM